MDFESEQQTADRNVTKAKMDFERLRCDLPDLKIAAAEAALEKIENL